MRIATLILSLILAMVVLLQSCAAAIGESLEESSSGEESSGAASVGFLVFLLWIVGAAFVLAKPRVSLIVFCIAAPLAFIGGAAGDFGDLYVWGVVSLIFAAMSYGGMRELRKRQPVAAPAVVAETTTPE